VNPRENHPSVSEGPLHDRGGSVGISADNRTPAGELWAILPVLIERLSSGRGNRYRCLADTPSFGSVKPEPRP